MNPVLACTAAAVAVVVGVLVLRAHQRRIGWLLIAHGLCFGALLSAPGAGGELGLVLDQLTAGAWVLLFVWLAVIGYLVPDGRTVSPLWRRWMQLGLVGAVALVLGAVGDAEAFRDAHHGVDPPVPWLPAPVSGVLGVVGLLGTVLLLVGSVAAVRSRLRTATGEARLQLLWLVWGATGLPTALALGWVAHFLFGDAPLVADAALLLAGLALPLTIGVAVLRHRLFDIELVLSRTLVYGSLVVGVVVLYALLLVGADLVLGDGALGGLLAVGAVAVAVHPAYAFLRVRIERWVYGYRSDPAAALRRLGADLEQADPLHVVDTVTASVVEALRVDAAWLEPPGSPATDDPRTVRTPLLHRGERVGDLVVALPPGRDLAAGDTALLRDLARYAAVTVRAARLAAELSASRARIVTAREEERRRLRRDLHDGVGPSLAAILLKLHAAQSRGDEADRNALVAEIRAETRAAIAEVRRVVDDLRPPAIDEVGLVGAVRQRARAMSTGAVVFMVEGPATMPPLPAAVEVAAFRIASEAMTNVVKHADAARCTVTVTVDGTLELTVADNGRGPAATGQGYRGDGVGWTSMEERAAEVGGTCTFSARAEGGFLVRAVLPLHGVPAEVAL